MSIYALALSFILYLVVAFDQISMGKYGQFMIWSGYAFSQIGFIVSYFSENSLDK